MSVASALTLIFCLFYFAISIFIVRGLRLTAKDICVAGLIIAITIVLTLILIPLPTGASWSLCAPVPLMLMALVWDKRLAIVAGWVCGVLVIFVSAPWQPVHWAQIFVEHLICFSCLGYAGLFGYKTKGRLILGLLLATVLKTVAHILSGALFFGQYAWEGWGAWGYSLVYNLTQNIPLMLLCCGIVLALPLKTITRAIGKEVAV
ncbi:energy-coupled thiamine transporter ThiT [Bengtsoniella intestinalis]|uniref:energy-coupled thiamine transporter ThiT n=1 Tax=Bengtsoniella intestinalis TaxID=3073143 RepID=UPI00391F8038